MRATLGFLEKLTSRPRDVTPDDVDAVSTTGVSDAAIEDAIFVCAAFSILDRAADSFGYEPGPAVQGMTVGAASSMKYGYRPRAFLHSRR